MIISFPAKDGNGFMRFDLDEPQAVDNIKNYATGDAKIRLKDGGIYSVPANQFSAEHLEWVKNNMVKDHLHPRDYDAPLFSREVGAAIKERGMELFGGSLSEGGAVQAAKKFALGALDEVADIGFTARKAIAARPEIVAGPIAVATGALADVVAPSRKEARKERVAAVEAEQSMAKEFIEGEIEKAGGRDVFSSAGELSVELAGAGATYGAVRGAVLRAAPQLAPKAGATMLAALRSGNLPMATRLLEAAKAAGFEAGVAGASTFGYELASGESVGDALKSGVVGGVLGGVAAGVGSATLGARAAQKTAAAEAKAAISDAVETEARKEVAMKLLTAGSYNMPGTVQPVESGIPMTMDRVLFEFGEAGFVKLPWFKRKDPLTDDITDMATLDGVRRILTRSAQAAISEIEPLQAALGNDAYVAAKASRGIAAEADMAFRLGKYKMGQDGKPYLETKETMGAWVLEPIAEKVGRSSIKKLIKINGRPADVVLDEYRTGRMLAAEMARNKDYVLDKKWSKDRIIKAQNDVAGLRESNPDAFKSIAEADGRMAAFYNRVLRDDLDAGLIGQRDYDAIMERYKKTGYHPLRRVEDVKSMAAYLSGGKRIPAKLKSRSEKGSEREILNSVEDLYRYSVTRHMAREKNKYLNTITDMLRNNPETSQLVKVSYVQSPGKKATWTSDDVFIRSLSEGLKDNQYKIHRVVDGRAKTFTVEIDSPEIFKAIISASRAEMGILEKMAVVAARVKRASIINTPAFLERTTFKGALDAATQAQWARPLHEMFREQGVLPTLFSSEFWNSNIVPWTLPKTIAENFALMTRSISGMDVRNVLASPLGAKGADLKYLNNYLVQSRGGGMVSEGVGGALENSWRNHAAYRLLRDAIKRGEDVTSKEFADRMAMVRRELGGDYLEKGFKMHDWGGKVPFLNATIAGLRSNIKRLKADPYGMAFRMAQISLAPAAISFFAMKDNDEYNALTPFERVTRMYVAPGVWLPRAYGLPGFVHYTAEEILRTAYLNAPKAQADEISAAIQYAFINTPIPAWADIAVTALLGYSVFRGEMLETESMKKNLPPEMWERRGTTPAAKAIAKAARDLPLPPGAKSPIRIDATMDAIFGPLGNVGMQVASSAVTRAKGETPPAEHISRQRFVETATRVPPTERASGYVGAMYDFEKNLAVAKKKIEAAEKDGDRRRIEKIMSSNRHLIGNESDIRRAVRMIKEVRDAEKEIAAADGKRFTPQMKRDRIAALYRELNAELRATFEAIEKQRKAQ